MDCILCEYIIVHVAFQGGHFYEMWDPHLVFYWTGAVHLHTSLKNKNEHKQLS